MRRHLRPPRWLLGAAALLGLLCLVGLLWPTTRESSLSQHQQHDARGRGGAVYEPLGLRGAQARAARAIGSASNRTLVLYVYHESSEHYVENLRFFIKVAIEAHSASSVDYLMIVNGESRMLGELTALAAARPNVRVLPRANACYDGGTIGEVLRAHPELLAGTYGYYVLMNSSVRGPFLPRFYPGGRPWTAALTGLLTAEVKLAGTTISCQTQVHVQSMVLATDNTGLEVLLGAGALDCPADLMDAIQRYELASTAAILDAGYNIDCLLTRYRGLDWRAQRGLQCNGAKNPQGDRMNDGLTVDPFEVLFVKAKGYPRVPATAAFLDRYTDYYMHGPGADTGVDTGGTEEQGQNRKKPPPPTKAQLTALEGNAFLGPAVQQELQRERAALWRKAARCGAAFDAAFYRARNPDLAGMSDEEARAHFDEHGFFERRAYRFEVAGPSGATAVVRRKEQQGEDGQAWAPAGLEEGTRLGGESEPAGMDDSDCTFDI